MHPPKKKKKTKDVRSEWKDGGISFSQKGKEKEKEAKVERKKKRSGRENKKQTNKKRNCPSYSFSTLPFSK